MGNMWDAADLVQETLVRGFSHLGQKARCNSFGYVMSTMSMLVVVVLAPLPARVVSEIWWVSFLDFDLGFFDWEEGRVETVR